MATMEMEARLPIGFRFRPTDEELLLHYLRRKALGCALPADIIPDADLSHLHPRDLLPGDSAGEERFFFHLPATRYWRRGGRASRAAAGGAGVWRASGKEKLVVSPRCKRPVGAKCTLVFCLRGGRGTEWAMHEYRLLPAAFHPHGCADHSNPPPPHAVEPKDWVVCRIFKRTKPGHRGREDDAAQSPPSSPASSCVTDTSEHGDEEAEQSSGGGGNGSVASNRRE